MSARLNARKSLDLRRLEDAVFEIPNRRDKVSDRQWEAAVARARELREIAALPAGRRAERVCEAARRLELSRSTIYRSLKAFGGRVTDALGRQPGSPTGTCKLDPEVREIVYRHIQSHYLTVQRPSLKSVVDAIRTECRERALSPPSYSSVDRILSRLDQLEVARRRGERDKVQALDLKPGTYDVREPMSVWQIDHTLLDVIIVSELDRKPLGRAWVTMIIDVASRLVAGYYLTFEAPGSHSVAQALAVAVAGKEALLASHGLTGRWPIRGKPSHLHSDNGSEFAKAVAYRRGCEDHLIDVVLRPIGKPHYGGHIERLIGSMMGRARLLPGATFSSPKQRGGYDSEKTACLTLYEVDRWFLEQILAYHTRRHSTLGMTPLAAWDHLCEQYQYVPDEVDDVETFRRDFLPIRTKRIGRKGITYQTLEYTGDIVRVRKRSGAGQVEFRYDPADMSCVYVKDTDGRYHAASLNYPNAPRVTEWEVRAELRRRKLAGEGPSNCALTIAGIMQQRAARWEREQPTRRDRREIARLRQFGISAPSEPDVMTTRGRWRALLGDGGRDA